MDINKVVYGDQTLIDLTNDTVTPQTLATGVTAHDRSGALISGSYTGLPSGGTTGQVLAKSSDDDYVVAWDTIAVPSKVSDLTNDSGFITGMTILSYGSSTWNDFLTAYQANKVVYCRASSNSNPASGAQTRMAFMAYIGGTIETPTSVEFQYYRSVNSHSATQQGDQVYIYKLDKTAGWTVTVRENYTKIAAGTGLSSSYSSGTLTLSNAVNYCRKAPLIVVSYQEAVEGEPAYYFVVGTEIDYLVYFTNFINDNTSSLFPVLRYKKSLMYDTYSETMATDDDYEDYQFVKFWTTHTWDSSRWLNVYIGHVLFATTVVENGSVKYKTFLIEGDIHRDNIENITPVYSETTIGLAPSASGVSF